MASPSGNASSAPFEHRSGRSRRAFLKRAAALGLGAAGLSGVLAGCGEGEETRTRPDGDVQTPTGENPEPGLSEEVVDCESTEQLSEQDLNVRNALDYKPESPEEGESCANCQFFEAPGSGDTPGCGGCTLFPGPVVAGGWCTSWAAKRG